MNKKLIVPFNYDLEIIDFYIENKDSIFGVYFPAHPDIYKNARVKEFPYSYEEYKRILYECSKLLNDNGIQILILFNSPEGILKYLTDESLNKIKEEIEFYEKIKVYSITVYNPFFIDFIKKCSSKIKVNASVLFESNSVRQINSIANLGVDNICIRNNLLRDEDSLKDIKKYIPNLTLTAMINSGCMSNCPYYLQHHITGGEVEYYKESDKYSSFLHNKATDFNYNILKTGFILPSQLDYYDNYFDFYKIKGREGNTELLKTMISYYIKRINPKDIFDIVRNPCAKQKKFKLTETKINKFCEYTKNCKYNCYKCHLCDELIRSDINE